MIGERRYSHRQFVFLLLLLLPLQAWGATYYMRADGTAANKGAATGPCGTRANAMNVSVHNGQSFSAGDTIYLCDDGGDYKTQMNFTSSGSEGNPIKYQAASGDSPTFNGSEVVSTWSYKTGNVWSATLTSEPSQVLFDETWGIGESGSCPGSLNVDKEWCWASNTLYQHSTSDPDTRYTSPGTEAIIRHNIVNTSGRDYITLDGVTATKGVYGIYDGGNGTNLVIKNNTLTFNRYDGIILNGSGSTKLTFDNNVMHDNYRHGILVAGSDGATITNNTTYNHNSILYDCGIAVSNGADGYTINSNTSYNNWYGIKAVSNANSGTISNNTVHDTDDFCIDLDDAISGTTVERNTVYNCGSHGIMVELNSTGNIVRYNEVYSAGDGSAGIHVGAPTTNNNVYYNLVHDVYDGIKVYQSTGCNVYNNIVYNASHDGIVFFSNSTNGNAKNNIVHTTGGPYGILNSETAGVCSNNITYAITGSGITCTTKTNNQENTDPLMTDPDNGNFTLPSGSPAINAGVDVFLPQDYAGRAVPYGSAPDIGAYELSSIEKKPTTPYNLKIR